jgi:hypothetical protein
MDGRQVFEQAFSPDPFGPTTQIARSLKMPVKPTAAVETTLSSQGLGRIAPRPATYSPVASRQVV